MPMKTIHFPSLPGWVSLPQQRANEFWGSLEPVRRAHFSVPSVAPRRGEP
jgi:hypothetical protein